LTVFGMGGGPVEAGTGTGTAGGGNMLLFPPSCGSVTGAGTAGTAAEEAEEVTLAASRDCKDTGMKAAAGAGGAGGAGIGAKVGELWKYCWSGAAGLDIAPAPTLA
jgi:hypothetical protein